MDDIASALAHLQSASEELLSEQFRMNPDRIYQVCQRFETLINRPTPAPSPPASNLSREDRTDGLESTVRDVRCESPAASSVQGLADFENSADFANSADIESSTLGIFPHTFEDYLTTVKYGNLVSRLLKRLQRDKIIRFLSKPVREAVGQPPTDKDFRFVDRLLCEGKKQGAQIVLRGILCDRGVAIGFDKWQDDRKFCPTRIQAIVADRAACQRKERKGSMLSFIRSCYPKEQLKEQRLRERAVKDGIRRLVFEKVCEKEHGVELRGISILLMWLPGFRNVPFEEYDDLISVLAKHVGIVRLAKHMYDWLLKCQDFYNSGSRSDYKIFDEPNDSHDLRLLLRSGSPNDDSYNSVEQSNGKRKRSDESRPFRSHKRRTDVGQIPCFEATTRFSPTQSAQPALSSADEGALEPRIEIHQSSLQPRGCRFLEYNVTPQAEFAGHAESRDLVEEPLDLLVTAAQHASQSEVTDTISQTSFHDSSGSLLLDSFGYHPLLELDTLDGFAIHPPFDIDALNGLDAHSPLELDALDEFNMHLPLDLNDLNEFDMHPPLDLDDCTSHAP